MAHFPIRKTVEIEKTNESTMLARFQVGKVVLAPLVVRDAIVRGVNCEPEADTRVELAIPGKTEGFHFVVESRSRSTPESIRSAIRQAKKAVMGGEWPLIQVPYLSPKALDELEEEGVSGVDLCGNGIVIIPGRLYILRSGQPNQYPDSRPLNNPYRGRSAMVARMLLQCPHWSSLTELAAAIETAGEKLSLPQVSKAVQALKEDLIVSKHAGSISLIDPLRLLDKLGSQCRKPATGSRLALRVPPGTDWAGVLSSSPSLIWAVSGESSVSHYTMFSQGGPRHLAVSDAVLAMTLLQGNPEPIPSFADFELIETDSPDFYFGNEIDERGVRWASRLQTWLELQCGDARQQDAARELRKQLLEGTQP